VLEASDAAVRRWGSVEPGTRLDPSALPRMIPALLTFATALIPGFDGFPPWQVTCGRSLRCEAAVLMGGSRHTCLLCLLWR
jgi:hypothetical protein